MQNASAGYTSYGSRYRKLLRFAPAIAVLPVAIPVLFWLSAKVLAEGEPGLVPVLNTDFQPQIGIWYTVWWDDKPPYASHWDEWTRYTPVIGEYSAGDPDVIRRHMQWIKAAGIDFVILDDTNGHFADGGNIARHIDMIFDVVESMPPGTAPQLALAIGGAQWMLGSLAEHRFEADIVYNRYARRPSYYRWKGKPLLINYTSPEWFARWDDERFTVRRATGTVSHALLQAPETGLWGWVFDMHVPNREVYGVMPGWDTAHLGRGTTPIDREQGALYTRMWMDALSRNPDMIVIVSFNDHAEETGIEAVVPKSPDVPVWVDSYGNPTPGWYEKITRGYASLKHGFLEGFVYQVEGEDQMFIYQNGEMVPVDAVPAHQPVIVLPREYVTGEFRPLDEVSAGYGGGNRGAEGAVAGHPDSGQVVVDLAHHWLSNARRTGSPWRFETVLESGEVYDGLAFGAEFYYLARADLTAPADFTARGDVNAGNDVTARADVTLSQIPDEAPLARAALKAHPAWNGAVGWVVARVDVDLPAGACLRLTYDPGKESPHGDGITLTVYVNDDVVDYRWVTGGAGWKEQVSVDLSAYSGQTVTLTFKVGWGREALGDRATTAYDSLVIGEPRIVSSGSCNTTAHPSSTGT